MTADLGESFDASVGLAFSLKAFETYRKSGVLSAEIRSIPGTRGKCKVYLELTQGKATSCYLVDRAGARQAVSLQLLLQLDAEKGPFGWFFRSSPRPPVPHPLTHSLNSGHLQSWPPEQQRDIQRVFSLVDGQRGVDEIKAQSALPSTTIDEILRVLVVLRAIALH